MEKPFTFFNLNLSNYDMREDILFDSENYNIYENVMAFIMPNSNAFPIFSAFLLEYHLNVLRLHQGRSFKDRSP